MLTLILALKQQFTTHINGEVKRINIKNRTYYFYNDMINLKDFKSNMLKIGKESYKSIDFSYIGYITIKIDDYENIYSVNPLYCRINHASGYIEEKNGEKYLIFDSVDESKEVLKNTQMFEMELNMRLKQ